MGDDSAPEERRARGRPIRSRAIAARAAIAAPGGRLRHPPPPAIPLVGILEVKLHPPAQKSGTVRRDRPLRMVAAAPHASVIAVIAPLGYGKSTLLRQVAAEDERPTAWVSLDPRDDDPVV